MKYVTSTTHSLSDFWEASRESSGGSLIICKSGDIYIYINKKYATCFD